MPGWASAVSPHACRSPSPRGTHPNRADALFTETDERLLIFDAKAADRYGEVVAARQDEGRPISVADAIIASIAGVHRASLATRNIRDFDDCGINVVNLYDLWIPD